MSSAEYEVNESYRGNYQTLKNTWCGKNIPKVAYDTFNPPQSFSKHCPGNWNDTSFRYPSMGTQIVLESKTDGYNSLTHNAPPSTSGYFKIRPAYNNDQYGYSLRRRRCDGSFVKSNVRSPSINEMDFPNETNLFANDFGPSIQKYKVYNKYTLYYLTQTDPDPNIANTTVCIAPPNAGIDCTNALCQATLTYSGKYSSTGNCANFQPLMSQATLQKYNDAARNEQTYGPFYITYYYDPTTTPNYAELNVAMEYSPSKWKNVYYNQYNF